MHTIDVAGGLMQMPIASHTEPTPGNSAQSIPIRVLLVDDSVKMLKLLAGFLMESTRMHILEMVNCGEDALERVRALRPDLVLMDITMPGMGGLEATRRIKAQPGAPRVVVVSLHDDPAYLDAARAVGGDGFVNKAEIREKLLPVIEELFPQRVRALA